MAEYYYESVESVIERRIGKYLGAESSNEIITEINVILNNPRIST